MAEESDHPNPEPLDEFVAELVRLREAAGNPSFRAMAARSGAVSHATLHQTVAGNRLQPWETVREFVRACDGDEEALHEHWQRVHLALTESEGESPGGDGGDEHRGSRRGSRRLLVIGAAVLVVACATVVTLTVVDDRRATPTGKPSSTPATPTGPAVEGDVVRFIADITYKDGAIVRPGKKFTKVWEIQNVGTVTWRDRYLRRVDKAISSADCRAPSRVPIAETKPRERVRISVPVTAPSMAPAECMVRWKMVDKRGHEFFPTNRPIYFQVHIRD